MAEVFFAGAWRSLVRGEVQIGGAWRRVTRGDVYKDGQWRSAFTFIPPLSLSAPLAVFGYRNSSKPTFATVVSEPATATPVGGSAPFSYAWTVIEGSVTISSPSNATTTVSAYLSPNTERTGVIRVVCTDSLGTTASANVEFSLSNQSDF